MNEVSFPLAFLAGTLSFLSPCVLPLVPSYLSFITGLTFEDLTEGIDRKKIRSITIKSSLAFIVGFSTIFITLGASSSVVGSFLFNYQDSIRIIGGVIVIIFGLFVAGFLKLAHRRLGREAAQALSISALAARGDAKEIRRQHKELTRE